MLKVFENGGLGAKTFYKKFFPHHSRTESPSLCITLLCNAQIKNINLIKKYNIMRKYYVEKYSFYKLLEDLNSLPFGACATPLYYNKRFDFIDVYVIFMQDEISPPDKSDDPKKTQIGAFFYRKPKDVRRSSQVVPICQIWFDLSEIVELVLCPQVRFVDDLLNALGNKYTEIYTCLEDACKYDTQY